MYTGSLFDPNKRLFNSPKERKAIDKSKNLDHLEKTFYLKDHAIPFKGFWVVQKRFHGFKKLTHKSIANLIIEPGTILYTSTKSDKIRASSAFVHSIWDPKKKSFVPSRNALFDPRFTYSIGKTVTPKLPFSPARAPCESGIHFYLNLTGALNH